MPKSSFADWLAALLRHLHFPEAATPSPVATFHFEGKPDVHVTGSQGQVDIMSEAGQLSAPYSSDTLLGLLALNRCSGADDPANVTLHSASGTVIVWARQRQAALDAAGGARLLQAVQQKSEAAQRLLGKPKAASRRDANALKRLLPRQVQNPT
jgi:hypothetical protein